MRIWAILLLLLLPLQWVSAATDRYAPHDSGHSQQQEMQAAAKTDGKHQHDCPQCHILCLKGLSGPALPSVVPAPASFMSAPESQPPSPLLGHPERPPHAHAVRFPVPA